MLSRMEKVSRRLKSWKTKPRLSRRKAAQLRFPDLAHGRAVQQHLPAGGLVQGRQDVQQRGLAGAAFPHDGYILARLHGKTDVPQGFHPAAAKAGGVHFL